MKVNHLLFPSGEEIELRDSSFFKRFGLSKRLPSPAEVRDVASQSSKPRSGLITRPPPVTFPALGVLVKYGTKVSIAEARCLLFVRSALLGIVPVPEVYGWRKDVEQTFIYMELVEGDTLEERWETIAEYQKVDICQQLQSMVLAWRSLKQEPHEQFIGHVGKEPLLDITLTNSLSPSAGPFTTVSGFHDWFTTSYGPNKDTADRLSHPYRSYLPDNGPVVFTHADLHPSNIILAHGPNPRVVSIVDWHQSGWYPEYWEYCKARWTSHIGQEWESKYLPLVLQQHVCYDYWDSFILARGL